MTSRAIVRDAFLPALRTVFWTWLAVMSDSRPGCDGPCRDPGPSGQEFVVVFYPTESEGPPVQRWQFSLPVVEKARRTRQRPAGGHLARFAKQSLG